MLLNSSALLYNGKHSLALSASSVAIVCICWARYIVVGAPYNIYSIIVVIVIVLGASFCYADTVRLLALVTLTALPTELAYLYTAIYIWICIYILVCVYVYATATRWPSFNCWHSFDGAAAWFFTSLHKWRVFYPHIFTKISTFYAKAHMHTAIHMHTCALQIIMVQWFFDFLFLFFFFGIFPQHVSYFLLN